MQPDLLPIVVSQRFEPLDFFRVKLVGRDDAERLFALLRPNGEQGETVLARDQPDVGNLDLRRLLVLARRGLGLHLELGSAILGFEGMGDSVDCDEGFHQSSPEMYSVRVSFCPPVEMLPVMPAPVVAPCLTMPLLDTMR
ncbi:hypothetical protein D9M68_845650 [compost metagenome]